jgi:hypothetical protein
VRARNPRENRAKTRAHIRAQTYTV